MGYPNSTTPTGTARTNREPVSIGEALAEAMPELATRARRAAPIGATLTIPLSDEGTTTLGDLRDLLDLTKRLPDSDIVEVHTPLDPSMHGTITVIVGSGDAA